MSAPRTDWFSPQTILAIVGMGAAFLAFCINFDRRITTVELGVQQVTSALRDHKNDEENRLARIEAKIDRLSERGK